MWRMGEMGRMRSMGSMGKMDRSSSFDNFITKVRRELGFFPNLVSGCPGGLFAVDGGGEGAEVVLGGHYLAVGAGGADGYEVAGLGEGQGLFKAEGVSGLADGAYDVVTVGFGGGGGEVLDEVVGAVEGGSDEVGEAGVEDDEFFVDALLDINYAGNERAALPYYRSAELEVYFLAGTDAEMIMEHAEVVVEVGHGVSRRVVIVYAEASAYVDSGDHAVAVLVDVLEVVDALAEESEGLEGGDL